MPGIPDYRLTTRIRNNRILRRIEDAGYPSAAAFCRKYNIHGGQLSALVTMRMSPIGKRGEWLKIVETMALGLGCLPEDLFNERQIEAGLETRVIEHEIDEPVLSLEEPSIRQIETNELTLENRELLRSLLHRTELTERERFIVMRRYGLDDETGDGEWTLQELADKYHVSGARIRELEHNGLRKMRSKAVAVGIKELDGAKLVPACRGGNVWVPEGKNPEPIDKRPRLTPWWLRDDPDDDAQET